MSIVACWEKRVGAFGVAGTLKTKKPNVGEHNIAECLTKNPTFLKMLVWKITANISDRIFPYFTTPSIKITLG